MCKTEMIMLTSQYKGILKILQPVKCFRFAVNTNYLYFTEHLLLEMWLCWAWFHGSLDLSSHYHVEEQIRKGPQLIKRMT